MPNRVYPQMFMALSKELRERIAEEFCVGRTSIIEIRDQEVISDGRTLDDLSVINEANMAAYVGSVEPFMRLWELTVAKAYSELHPPVAVIGSEPKEEEKIVNNHESTHATKKSK